MSRGKHEIAARQAFIGPQMIYVPEEMWDFFGDEPLSERMAYVWLANNGPVKSWPKLLASRWYWRDVKKVSRFVRRMRMCGLFVEQDGMLSAVQLDERQPCDEANIRWRVLREMVFDRDGRRCVYCGCGENLHCDHVMPRVRGGLDTLENLTTACRTCNLSKGAKTPEEWRQ